MMKKILLQILLLCVTVGSYAYQAVDSLIYPIDRQPTLIKWDFKNVAASTVSNIPASFKNNLVNVTSLTQVNGTNAIGTRGAAPFGTVAVSGTLPYPEASLAIGMATTGTVDAVTAFGYEFTISSPVAHTVNLQQIRFNLGYDSTVEGSYMQPYCRLYVSEDGGTTWNTVGNAVGVGNLSSAFSSQAGTGSGGGYYIASRSILISNNNNTIWSTPERPLTFRLIFYEGSSSSLNTRRTVLSDVNIDGTVMKIGQTPSHAIIYENGDHAVPQFSAWTANGFHQIWRGDCGLDRIVMSFETGNWVDNPNGHDLDFATDHIRFAKTENGGQSWTSTVKPNVKLYSDINTSVDIIPRTQLNLADTNMGVFFHYNYMYWTTDKGETFTGPARFSPTNFPWIFENRSSYIKLSNTEAINFSTARRRTAVPGDTVRRNRVIIARTMDGYLSDPTMGPLLGPVDMFDAVAANYSAYSIMPRGVKMGAAGHYVITARELWRTHKWAGIYETKDDFATPPKLISRQAQNAESGMAMIKLSDGRLCLIYGNRQNGPKSICASFSKDGGHTWSIPVIIRSGGASWDLGYPIAFELSNGRVWVAYYWHDASNPNQHIAQTIFDPSAQEFSNLPLQPVYKE